ncbi:MAG TPA: hypothetical protein VK651_08820, partial [Blastocatellia bacterium]|nr:hypothetical protein [Blastocatellia bacterium]
MLIRRPTNILAALLLLVVQPFSPLAKQSPSQAARANDSQSQANKDKTSQTTNEGAQHAPRSASEQATRLRRTLSVLPSLIRGGDGLLSIEGQRATQSQLVTSTNVKDPVTDAFSFTAGLPVETANPVQIPTEQFSVSLAKFYATVPVLDSIGGSGWNFALGAPFFAIGRADGSWQGLRSAAPMASATGPLFGRRLMLYQSFAYAFSRQTVESIFGTKNDSRFQSYDSNTHVDIRALRGHVMSSRLALFSQDIDSATLNALTVPEATPDYLMRGGQLSFADAYTTQSGVILDSSVSYKTLLARVRPRGSEPMVFVEQGELSGNYFDNVHHNGSRFEWKEGLQLPEKSGWGKHHIGFGGGLARAAF